MQAQPTIDLATELLARARLICGPRHVLTDPVVLSTYRSDGVRRDGPLPLAAILPGSASEVAGVVAACADAEIAWTVRGAGTSTSGVALAAAGQVLIVLTRMRRILRGRDADGELTLEPGVPLATLQRLSAVPWVSGAALAGTVGGHVALTPGVRTLTALELIDPDGRLVQFDSRQPGYDVVGAFCGSCGRAGIAVSLSLRLEGLL
jgi:glycolate oxidase